MSARLSAAVTCLALLGCVNAPLNGSVSELFPLDVSGLVVQVNSEAFQVTYFRNQPTALDIVASIGVALSGLNFSPGATIDLSGTYAADHPRCTVVHHADGEPERTLPAIQKGTLHLSGGGQPDQGTNGNFSMSFVSDGSFGSGRTLYGSFNAVAVDAGF